MLFQAGETIRAYRIIEQLGQGGQGRIILTEQVNVFLQAGWIQVQAQVFLDQTNL